MTTVAGASLPQSQQSDFRELIRLYDIRSYKLAIKLADRIVKSLPANSPSCALSLISSHTQQWRYKYLII